jgi:hypothetical protein
MSVRVWSADAGIAVHPKVENSSDPGSSVETEATVTTAAGWETLTFDFANPAAGTTALNLAFNHNKASICVDLKRDQASTVLETCRFNDMAFAAGKGGSVGFFVGPRLFAVKVFEDGSVCSRIKLRSQGDAESLGQPTSRPWSTWCCRARPTPPAPIPRGGRR